MDIERAINKIVIALLDLYDMAELQPSLLLQVQYSKNIL